MTSLIWNGGTGSWFDAANWTPAQVPQSGDSATVTRGSIQLTSNPSDAVTLNLDAVSSPNTVLDARNVTFGSHFTIVADGVNNVAITGSVVDQGQISVPKALSLLGHSANDLFTTERLSISMVGRCLHTLTLRIRAKSMYPAQAPSSGTLTSGRPSRGL